MLSGRQRNVSRKISEMDGGSHVALRWQAQKNFPAPRMTARSGLIAILLAGLICLSLNSWVALADRPPSLFHPEPGMTITQVAGIAKAGASHLALRLIQSQQPPFVGHSRSWSNWERLRMQVLSTHGAWQAIRHQVNQLPANLPPKIRAQFLRYGVRADLALLDGRAARSLLTELIWNGQSAPPGPQLRHLRRLLIESYLDAGWLDDARLAVQNYALDYTPRTRVERMVLAQAWMQVHEPHHALMLLSPDRHGAAYWLYLLAAFRAHQWSAAVVIDKASATLKNKRLPLIEASRLWGVIFIAARASHARTLEVSALEHFLTLAPHLPLSPLLSFNGDTLWQAYRRLALAFGNHQGLLIGNDAAWEKAVERVGKKGEITLARAINAFLALKGRSEQARVLGYRWLSLSLIKQGQGQQLLARLFLHAPKDFPRPGRIPAAIRLALANDAVDRGDLTLAAKLMQTVNRPPPGENPYLWSLRVARVLILGGHLQKGTKQLKALIARRPEFASPQADQLMQVLFDLQSIHRNRVALQLFSQLYPKLVHPLKRREVLFWEAESYQAIGKPLQAATSYLLSAALIPAVAYDPWAISARYHAALALARAGFTRDARRVLRDLLSHVSDPRQIMALKKKLANLEQTPTVGMAPQSHASKS